MFQAIAIEAAIYAGLYLFHWLFGPGSPPAVARTRDSLQLPRTEEGSGIPLVYGRNQVKSPMVIWMGDLNTKMGPDDQYITYGMFMLFAVGIPMGAGVTRGNSLAGPLLHNAWIGDKLLPSPGMLPRAGSTIKYAKQVFQPGWFGGPGRGGGLLGAYQWFGGWSDQSFTSPASPIGDAMTAQIPASKIPGCRGIMCVSFHYVPESSSPYFSQTQGDGTGGTSSAFPVPAGFVLGENPSVDGLAFEVSAYGDKVFSMITPGYDFGGDADPAEVIYDLITNPWARVGLDTTMIETASFAAASAALKAENHGVSLVVYDTEDVRDVLAKILAQINAVLFWEPTTDKFSLHLIRNDYTVNGDGSVTSTWGTAPAFTVDNVYDVTDYSFGAWRESVNEVRVRFTNRGQANPQSAGIYATETAVASSLANAVGNSNRRRPKQIDYLGCSNAVLAAKLAARDLNMLSTPVGKVSFAANRDAWTLRPGQPFTLTFPEFGLNKVLFRVSKIDFGKIDDNKIFVDAIQDAFSTDYTGANSTVTQRITPPTALAVRSVIEAPRWLAHEAHLGGLINDPDMTRIFALPVNGGFGDGYYVNSKQTSNAASELFSQLLQDIPFQPFAVTVTVAVAYSRALEPYDTATGLVVNCPSNIAGLVATEVSIRYHGATLCCIVNARGEHEFIAFESVFSLGSNQYRLQRVWRGLLDTSPLDHAVGETMFFVRPNMIGRRAWSAIKPISAQVVPTYTSLVGTGADPVETVPTVGPIANPWNFDQDIKVGFVARPYRPLPVGDYAILGDGIQGTLGIPAVAGHFKAISLLEEDVYLFGNKRELYSSLIRRGDDASDSLNTWSSYSWTPQTMPTGTYVPVWAQSPGILQDYSGGSVSAALGNYLVAGLLLDWFGTVDIGVATNTSLGSAAPGVGKGGLNIGAVLSSYTDPRVTAYAPSWRNLLGNARFDVTTFFVSAPYQWGLNTLPQPTIGSSSAFSISGQATGKGCHYLVPAGTTLDFFQSCLVDSWNPRGLTVAAVVYARNASSDANDTGQLFLTDTNTGSGTSGAVVPASGHWTRMTASMTMSTSIFSSTTFSMRMVSTEVAGGGSANADVCWTEAAARIGRFQQNVLTNFSFDTNTLAGWTSILNSFTTTATTQPSSFVAQGGAFASSQIRQEYTLPTGWESGATAFLTCFRAQNVTGDTGEVRVSAVDGSGVVLASATTGVENISPNNCWQRRTVFVDIPDGTTKIRVDLVANRLGGAGSSTAFFDEIDLWISKEMTPRYRKELNFSVPTQQYMPRTLAEFQLSYPTLPTPDFVFGGTDLNDEELLWTDGVVHDIGVFTGQFGGPEILASPYRDKVIGYGTPSVDSYRFVRGTGAAAPHIAAQHRGYSIGSYSLTDAFTAAVIFKIDEPNGFGGACGLFGRMDLGQGWGLELDASGHLVALLRGAGATTISTSLARNAADGGVHMAVLVYDGAGNLTVYDELGSSTIATGGLGDIQGTGSACHIRIGRDADDRAVMPGQVARAYIWDSALTAPQIAGLWTYAKDPNSAITTYTRSNSAWVTGAPSSDGGDTLYCAGPSQIAIPWNTILTTDDSEFPGTEDGGIVDKDTRGTPNFIQTYRMTGYGLAVGRAVANRIQSWDFRNSTYWFWENAPTYDTIDNAGRAAVTPLVSTTNGFIMQGIAVGAVARTITLIFWARAPGVGSPQIKIDLRTSAGTVLNTRNVTLTSTWKRYVVTGAFSGATSTCQWRVTAVSGGFSFDLSSVVYCGEQSATNANYPILIPGPAQSIGDTSAQVATTVPALFNSEGEIVAVANTTTFDFNATSPAASTIVRVKNASNTKNQRELLALNTGPSVRLAHTDGAAATVNSTTLLLTDWNHINKVRGRWDRIGLLDPNGSFFAQVAANDQTATLKTSVNYGGAGRSAIWTNDATTSSQIDIGTGTAAPEHLMLTYVGIYAREEKLP